MRLSRLGDLLALFFKMSQTKLKKYQNVCISTIILDIVRRKRFRKKLDSTNYN